jgi:hypothetical protein
MSQIDLPRRHHLDAITSERWTASDQNRWTPSVRYAWTASLESAVQATEPVFGIIKSVLGFRQFLLRGLDNVRGEWRIVTMAWNIKRMFVLAGAD